MLKPWLEYPVDLKEFEDLPRRRIWRLNPSEGSQVVNFLLRRDVNDWEHNEKSSLFNSSFFQNILYFNCNLLF